MLRKGFQGGDPQAHLQPVYCAPYSLLEKLFDLKLRGSREGKTSISYL